MSYKELQQLAKEHGIPANKKKAELVELLQEVEQENDQAEVTPMPVSTRHACKLPHMCAYLW